MKTKYEAIAYVMRFRDDPNSFVRKDRMIGSPDIKTSDPSEMRYFNDSESIFYAELFSRLIERCQVKITIQYGF